MRAQVNGIGINYHIEGHGPDVVLTHGIGGRLDHWERTTAALAPDYRILSWDVRGFGQSDKPHDPVTPELWTQDLAALLDVISIPRAIILGFSLGGVIAQRFALDYPERTSGLILMNTSSEVGPKVADRWKQTAEQIETDGMEAVAGQGSTLTFSEEFALAHPAELQAYRAKRLKNDPVCYAAACRAVSSYHYTRELERLACPTMILQGAQDRATPPGGSVIMSRHIPGARLEIIEGCGHMMAIERFDTMIALLRDFLAQFK